LARARKRCFSRSLQQRIALAYPAHLHINIDAGYRRMGVGRRLIEDYFAGLRSHGVHGVHLFCGAGPVEFYRRLGFQKLESAEVNSVLTFALGAHL
jgi:predicted N-acetyltransferase YhbS